MELKCKCGAPATYKYLQECNRCYRRRKYEEKYGVVYTPREQDLAEAKQKIMDYELGKPKTYTPIYNFPVTVRYVEPKPRVTVVVPKSSNVNTVPKPRARQDVVTVYVCECGAPISRYSTHCRACANRARVYVKAPKPVCPTCVGTKNKQSKQCRSCYNKKTVKTPKPKTVKQPTLCECGQRAVAKGLCNMHYARVYRKTHKEAKTNTCMDCGKAVTRKSLRCGSCANKAGMRRG